MNRPRRASTPLRGRALPAIVLVATTALSGCATPPSTTESPRPLDPPVLDEATRADAWRRVREAQQRRLEALGRWSSAVTATLRFRDRDDRLRTEQVDLRLWRIAPARAAVRLSKVGSAFLLAAWNGPRWWLLDESGDEDLLRILPVDRDSDSGAEGLLSPPALLCMLGLADYPDTPPDDLAILEVDAAGEPRRIRFTIAPIDWKSDSTRRIVLPGRLEVELGRVGRGPSAIRWVDDDGTPLAEATLERPESVETRGRPPGAWPVLPHRLRVLRPGGDEVVVSLDRPLAGGEISDRLFDLEAVRTRHPEAVVEDFTGGGIRP